MKREKLGILGGTFNPIHNGHLMLAEESMEQYKLDRVLILPNNLPAYKETADIISNAHRKEMIRLAIEGKKGLELSEIEMEREGFSYTIDTLHEMENLFPNSEIYFIIGADSLFTFHQWRSYKQILRRVILLCASRDSANKTELETAKKRLLTEEPVARIEFLETKDIPVSSSYLRKHIRDLSTEEQTQFLPDVVYRYILAHDLYP